MTESTDDDALDAPATPRAAADLRQIHDAHGDFVWRSLQRLGVRDADLADVYQEVFLVIHQRLHTFDGSSRLTTWLFGVCLRVASQHRRRAWVRRERPTDAPDAREDTAPRPDEALDARRRAARLRSILDALEPERRAVFVMFEVDGMSCEEIAAVVGSPLGTVYTRLRAARKDFEQAAARLRARDVWEETRR